MEIWTEQGNIGNGVEFGIAFNWEDKHLNQLRVELLFAGWYLNIFLRGKQKNKRGG
jgi:hypothetical protein